MKFWGIQLGAALLFAGSVQAQAPGASPIRDLLTTARDRLHDLRFREADSIARAVLEFPNLRRSERIQALQLAAGASFPEQESAQDRDRAVEILRTLIRVAPEASLARDVSWDGLDSLHRSVRRQTFGISAIPRNVNVLVGPDARAVIDVHASRPAKFELSARTGALERTWLLDSTDWIENGTLRFTMLRDGQPLLKGPFELVVSATDSTWGDTLQVRFASVVDAPPLERQAVPDRIDSTKLVPEITRPHKAGGIVAGAIALVGTILASRVIREAPFKGAIKQDGRATSVGIAIGLGAGAGVWLLDKGAPIKKNIEANREVRRAFADESEKVKAENRRRIAEYRLEVRVNPEPINP